MAKRNKSDPSKVAPAPTTEPQIASADPIVIESRVHSDDWTKYALAHENALAENALEETERQDAARIERLITVLRDMAANTHASGDARIEACEVLCKLFGGPDEVAERVLTEILEPPADYRTRVRAARLLLGL